MSESKAKGNTVLFVNPEQGKRCLAVLREAKVPAHFIGGPGTAKTSMHVQFVDAINAASKNKFGFWPIHLSSAEMGDFMLPIPDHATSRVKYYVTESLPFNQKDATGLVLFDDLTKARPELQPFVMNVMLDKFFHGNQLSDGVYVSATSNAASDLFNSEVCEALKTRACNLFMSANCPGYAESWDKFAQSRGFLPETRAFRKYCSDGLKVHEQFEEWAIFNDRTLEMADRIAATCKTTKVQTSDIFLPMLAGVIGRAEAIKYLEMGRLTAEAPTPEDVVAKPKTAKIPENPSVVFAMTCALVGHAKRDNAEKIGEYAVRLPNAHALMLIKGIKDKSGCNTIMLNGEVQKWCEDNTAILS